MNTIETKRGETTESIRKQETRKQAGTAPVQAAPKAERKTRWWQFFSIAQA